MGILKAHFSVKQSLSESQELNISLESKLLKLNTEKNNLNDEKENADRYLETSKIRLSQLEIDVENQVAFL